MTVTAYTRLYAVSDIHVDYAENMQRIVDLSDADYRQDSLILAGDVSDDLQLLAKVFIELKKKFAKVFYLPGNHELWVRRKECVSSVEKLRLIQQLCDDIGILREPRIIGYDRQSLPLWVVPLYSWYSQPEEGPYSLYWNKPGEDRTHEMWSDFYFTKWPELNTSVSEWFHALNEANIGKQYNGTVVSFSHFLPRQELIFWRGKPPTLAEIAAYADPVPGFNFSRVAGCQRLEAQIRRLGAKAHVYGHQHMNRAREYDGVKYISNCLGYPHERQRVYWRDANKTLLKIWDSESGLV
jgi:predicted phosphodiesterase